MKKVKHSTKHLAAYQFKPGQPSANPSGRPKSPIPDALKKMTKQSFRRIIRAVVKGNIDQLNKMVTDPKASALEVAVASSFMKAISRGDYATIEHILQRIVGKIPDEIVVRSRNLNANIDAPLDNEKVKIAVAKILGEI